MLRYIFCSQKGFCYIFFCGFCGEKSEREGMMEHVVEKFTELEPHAVLESLGIKGEVKLEKIPFGAETDVWKVTHEEKLYALRVFRSGEGAKQKREVAALRAAKSAGILVPDVIAQDVWQDRAALFLSWLPGKMLVLELNVQNSLGRVQMLSRKFGQTLAAIHRVTAPSELRGEPNAWVKLAGAEELELQERLFSLPLQTDALLHMDFHPLNVMLQGDNITGVLDWAGATAGDPRADFARFVTIANLGPVSPRPNAPAKTPEEVKLRQHTIKAFEQGYREMNDLGDDMALFYAWAGAALYNNVSSKIGKPGESVQHHHLEPVRKWINTWKDRAGLEIKKINSASQLDQKGEALWQF
jgi:aminoglycoside phosphotransferase (APT) family kinase protein